MPLTKEGKEVFKSMLKTYKNKKIAERIFYATENKLKRKWHIKKRSKK